MNALFFFLALVFSQPHTQEQAVFVSPVETGEVLLEDEQDLAPQVSEQVEPASIQMLFFGDMMLDRSVNTVIKEVGIKEIFKRVLGDDGLAPNADIISVNAEGPFANYRRETSKEIAFRFDPTYISALKELGVNLLSHANNHSLDMGVAGYIESVENIQSAGLTVYGHQSRISEEVSLVYKEINSSTIAFIGFDDTFPRLDIEAALKIIEDAEERADVTVVNIHWGQEYRAISNSEQQSLAYAFIDAGTDLIIGHHPHWVQQIEVYKNRPIFYSLGNFVFDQYFSIPTQQSIAVLVDLQGAEMKISVIPMEGKRSVAHRMQGDQAKAMLDDLVSRSTIDTYTITDTLQFATQIE